MSLYGFAAAAGPGLGPIAVAWAIDAKGWRWAFWEMLWLSGAAVIFLAVFMPEVSFTRYQGLR
jgi:DHA1 family multidrug resistance protein-like MFS transporter